MKTIYQKSGWTVARSSHRVAVYNNNELVCSAYVDRSLSDTDAMMAAVDQMQATNTALVVFQRHLLLQEGGPHV